MEEEVEAEEGLVTAEDEEDSGEDSGEEEVEASSPQTVEDFGAVAVAEEPQEAEGVEEGGVAEVVSEEGRRS